MEFKRLKAAPPQERSGTGIKKATRLLGQVPHVSFLSFSSLLSKNWLSWPIGS